MTDRLLRNSETLHGGLRPGVKLGSYQIDRPLGRGGFFRRDASTVLSGDDGPECRESPLTM
jgi:hypothetical protein